MAESSGRLSFVQPLRHAYGVPPPLARGGFGSPRKVNGFARGSPTRGAVERSETERLYEGEPDREALARLNLSVSADALPPPLPRGGLGSRVKLAGYARGAPTRGAGGRKPD